MNVVFLTGSVCSSYATDYALTLASTLRAEGHPVKVFIRRRDPRANYFASFEPQTLGRGGVFDVLAPVRLASSLRTLSGKTVIHVFNAKDARLALNAARLSERGDEVRVVVSLLHQPLKLKPWEQQALTQATVVADSPATAVGVSGARIIAPGLPDRRIDIPLTFKPLRLLYMGRLTKECTLHGLLKNLEDFAEADWTLDVCGSGRGSDVMGMVRRSRANGLESRIKWHGDDYEPMERLAQASVLVGEDSPANRLMADCSGRPFLSLDTKSDIEELLNNPEGLAELGARARQCYERDGIYARFYNDIIALYNEC